MDRAVVSTSLTGVSPDAGAPALDVRLLRTVDELRAASRLLAAVWRVPERESPGPVNILRALVDTEGYVAGAWLNGELVGAGYGLVYRTPSGALELRSQVTGTTTIGAGVGSALKTHQRHWAAERGLGAITWTFDPFVHRNARFNLVHLGAVVVRFVDNFYGPLHDGVNGDEETDRVVVRWATDTSAPIAPAGWTATTTAVLRVDADGEPRRAPRVGDAVTIEVPHSFTSADQRHRWRAAVREAMTTAIDGGLVARWFEDGRYVFCAPETRSVGQK